MVLGAPDPSLLQAARRLLREKGRLLIAGPAPGRTEQETVIALSEAGFVVLKVDLPAAVYLARKESFFVRDAYFTGANDPYKRLKQALKAEIDEEAWASLYRTRSRPFDPRLRLPGCLRDRAMLEE